MLLPTGRHLQAGARGRCSGPGSTHMATALHGAPGSAISRPGGSPLGGVQTALRHNNGRRRVAAASACGLRSSSAAALCASLQPLPCASLQPQQAGSSSSWRRRQGASGVGRACRSSWRRGAANTSGGSSSSGLAARPAAANGALVPLAPPADEHVWVPFKPDFYSSQPVQVQGSFNEWSGPFALHHDPETGKVGGVLRLEARDAHVVSFKYQVGETWFLSREDIATADNQGCINNSTLGRQRIRFSFPSVLLSAWAANGVSAEVHLVGSFTDWQVSIPLALGPDGNFHADVALTPGHHTFRFLLDAGAGPSNKALGGGPAGTYSPSTGKGLVIGTLPPGLTKSAGPHTNMPFVPSIPVPAAVTTAVTPDTRAARWTVVDWMPVETQPGGMRVNSVTVPPPALFKILYHTPFKEAYLTHRVAGTDKWTRVRMYHQPDAKGLMVAQIVLPHSTSATALEFSITGTTVVSTSSGSDSDGASSLAGTWDDDALQPQANGSSSSGGVVRDPPGGGAYTARGPGVWRLQDGDLHPDEAGMLPPLMLCTDLDGTLIEDQADDNDWVRSADAMTAAAAAYFSSYLAPAGGVVVFNTGRSIGLVEGLLKKKAGVMPRPAAIITAVGTKVFLWDVATERWVPDPGYARLLDAGWDADKVSQVTQELRNRFNGSVGIVDDGSEHPHRLSLSVRSDVCDKVTQRWSEELNRVGVQHQIVSSIGGEWRYLDCIASRAGKGRAMLYVASRYGVMPADVVAAGDSGNDLLMLGPVDGQAHPAIVMSNSHPEVWDWLRDISSQERMHVYTPKAERAAGLVEGMRAIIADKLRARVTPAAKAAAPTGGKQLRGGSSNGSSSSKTAMLH